MEKDKRIPKTVFGLNVEGEKQMKVFEVCSIGTISNVTNDAGYTESTIRNVDHTLANDAGEAADKTRKFYRKKYNSLEIVMINPILTIDIE